MPVPAQATLFNESVANGVTTSFPYQFMIASADDMAVELDGVATTTGFTVTGVGDANGGNIVFSAAPANGVKVLRYLNSKLNRTEDYQQFGDFNADTVDREFDRLWLAMQSHALKLGLCVRAPISSASGELPAPAANNVIGWNEDGTGFKNFAPVNNTLLSASLAAKSGSSLIGFDVSTLFASGTNGAAIKDRGISVKDFPYLAFCDGTHDDTASIQAAHDGLPAAGGKLIFPRGTCLISSVTFTKPVELIGEGRKASVIKSNSATLNTIVNSATGFKVSGIGFDCSTVKTAGAYIKTTGWHGVVEDVEFSKFYIGLDADGVVGLNIDKINAIDGTAHSVSANGAIIRVGETTYCGGINIGRVEADVNVPANQPTHGILLRYVDVASISDGLIIHHTNALKIAPKSGQFAALVRVSNSNFDTSERGIVIQPAAGGTVQRCTISQTWAGANTADGVMIDGTSGTVDGVHFSGIQAIGNTQIGVNVVGANAKNITFSHSQGAGNGGNGLQVTSGANVTWDGGVLGATDTAAGNGSSGAAIDASSTGAIRNCQMDGNTVSPLVNNNPSGFFVSGNSPYGWDVFTSTITAQTGTITTASGTLKYKRVNKTVHWSLVASITTNGTGAGSVIATLPFACVAGNNFVGSGRETNLTGKMLQGFINSGSSTILIYYYDGTYPGANGAGFTVSGVYEAA